MTTSNLQERVSRLAGLLAREREALAQFISELAAFDAQRCWESLGYPSLLEFLTRELRLSRAPLSNRAKAVGEDAKLLSVELSPRVVVPAREVVRAFVPERMTIAAVASAPSLPLLATPNPPPPPAPVHSVNGNDPKALDRTSQPVPTTAPSTPPETSEPLTGQLTRLHLTVSRELVAKIEAAQLALSHARPGATIADLLELGADTALAQDAKRKALVKKPRARPADAPSPSPASDHIPAELRRAVWERGRGCCQWKMASGEVCGSTYRLQYDHISPKGQGHGEKYMDPYLRARPPSASPRNATPAQRLRASVSGCAPRSASLPSPSPRSPWPAPPPAPARALAGPRRPPRPSR